MTRSIAELARRWAGTYVGDDPDPHPEELFAPKVLGWHNFDEQKVEYEGATLAQWLLRTRADIQREIPDFTVEKFNVHVADNAIVFVQTSVGTLPNGERFSIPSLVIWGVENGRIVTVYSVGDRVQRGVLDYIKPSLEEHEASAS